MEPTKKTDYTKTLIDYILTKYPIKVIQSCVIEMGLSDHEFLYCARKTSLLKSNEHYETSFNNSE